MGFKPVDDEKMRCPVCGEIIAEDQLRVRQRLILAGIEPNPSVNNSDGAKELRMNVEFYPESVYSHRECVLAKIPQILIGGGGPSVP